MDYSRQIATAKRLIAKYGQAVTWQKPIAVVADENKPWLPVADEESPVEYPVSIAFFSVGRIGKEFSRFMPGSEVTSGNLIGYMVGNVSFEPSLQDNVIRGDKTLRIISFEALAPNEQTILYKIEFDA